METFFECWGLAKVRRLLLLLLMGAWGVTWVGAAEKGVRHELDVEMLVPLMRKHQMPEPPGDAPLVLVHTHSHSGIGNQSDSRDPAIYGPAFLLEKKEEGQVVVMRGWKTMEVEVTKKSEPLTRTFSLDEPKPKLGGHIVTFSDANCFIAALQTGARGDHETAQALWRNYRNKLASWSPEMVFDSGYQNDQLGETIFIHLLQAAREGTMEWRMVRDRMKSCLEDFSTLGNAKYAGSPNDIYESLDLAVNAKPAKAGSVEDLLVRWSRVPCPTAFLGIWDMYPERHEKHELARQIVMQGYAAIPELERLENDRRFTARTVMQMGAEVRPTGHTVRLGELARDLHKELLGSLKSVQGLNEADGLVSAVFDYEGRLLRSLNETPLRILAAKYPERLPPLCEEFSRKAPDDLQPYDLANAVADCALPKEVRVSTLVEFAKRGSLEHKRCVLQNLAELDETKTAELLLPILRKLPKDARSRYWTCPEAAFAHVVKQLSDVRVWQAYLVAAKRSAVGMRMEMMHGMHYGYTGDEGMSLRLAFVGAFMDDTELRNRGKLSGKYDGPCAAFTFPKIEVRNFAAMQAASILDMDDEPDEHWSDEQWKRLRGKVRARLLEMKLPTLAP